MIYFVVALKEEIQEFSFEKFLGEDYKIIYTGVGKVNATLFLQEALINEKPDLVINIGTAGTLKHQIGDVLICKHFYDGDLVEIESAKKYIEMTLPAKYEKVFKPTASVMTQDTFYTSQVTCDVADMESFALSRVCDYYSVPFVAIKIVTDIIGHTSLTKWEEQLPRAREIALQKLKEINLSVVED